MEQNKMYKRTSRAQSPETRQKISQSLKGRQKSWSHCYHISKGMEAYWSNDDNFPDDTRPSGPNGTTTISDLI